MLRPRRHSAWHGPLLAVSTGCAIAFAQPGYDVWPLGPICLVPLLLALRGARARRRATLGWIAGTVGGALVTGRPVHVALTAYFDLPAWQAALASAAITQAFGALPFAVFGVLAGDLVRGRSWLLPARVGIAWVAGELVRGALFGGLPWGHLAYTLLPLPALLQGAALGGVLLVSAWLAGVNAGVAALGWPSHRRSCLAASALLTLAVAGGGWLSQPGEADAGAVRLSDGAVAAPALRVRLVQGDISNAQRRDPRRAVDGLRQLARLSAAEPVADLVIWPENAVTALLPFNQGMLGAALVTPLPWARFLLLGAPTADDLPPGRMRNSALLFDRELSELDSHHKVKLFPFSEFVPWPFSLLERSGLSVEPGAQPVVLAMDGARLGPLICYEVLFGSLARALVADGADVLVNLSNDSWFGATLGLDQHLAAAVLRAIEVRRPMLRATTTGLTAAIDARGRMRAVLPAHDEGVVEVAVVPRHGTSLYARVGDAPLWVAVAALAGWTVWEGRRAGGGATRRPRAG